jgi:hypothetical protein
MWQQILTGLQGLNAMRKAGDAKFAGMLSKEDISALSPILQGLSGSLQGGKENNVTPFSMGAIRGMPVSFNQRLPLQNPGGTWRQR